MKLAISLLVAAALLITGVAGCTGPRATSVAVAVPTDGDPGRAPDPRLADAINGFAFDLVRNVGSGPAEDTRTNTIVSPFSAHAALTMTLNGAAGTTEDEMLAALHLHELGLEDANVAYADLIAALARVDSRTSTTLAIANSLWPDSSNVPDPLFVEANRRYFGAHIEPTQLAGPDAADRINRWVAERTNGNITDVIDSMEGNPVLIIVNAVHIDAVWSRKFDEQNTHDRQFNVGSSSGVPETVRVPFLHETTTYRYKQTDHGQAVCLPFTDGRLVMWVVLPSPDEGGDAASRLDAMIADLDPEGWRSLVGAAEEHEVVLAMPKLDARDHSNLEAALSEMGMPSAFSPGAASFPGIAPDVDGSVWMERVLHETHLAVDEEGTRASATTTIIMAADSAEEAPRETPVEMTVDRPYLIAIEDAPTGTLLFLGAIYDPR